MIHFIVHGSQDNVGVAVSDLVKGQRLTGWNMETNQTVEAVAVQDVPLGHKIALKPVPAGEPVIKYNTPIGKATSPIAAGEHVHTHNLKSARW